MRRTIATTLAVLLLAGAGYAQTIVNSPARDLYDQAIFYVSSQYNGFSTADLKALDQKYSAQLSEKCGVDPACPFATAEPIIENLLKDLNDNHVNYYSPEDYKNLMDSTTPGGVVTPRPILGVRLTPLFKRNAVRILEVLPGSPGAGAGFKRGDLILSFNGKQWGNTRETLSVEHAAMAQEGKPIEYVVERGTQTIKLTATPAVFQYTQLPYLEDQGNGVYRLNIPSFINPDTGKTIHQLVHDAEAKNVTSLIVDLRNDGGGLSTECLSGVGAFIGDLERLRSSRTGSRIDGYKNGEVYTRTPDGTKLGTVYTIANPALWKGKLSVIVNKESGSCAEYFAADVQFAKRAPVIGEKTFGVGNTGTFIFPLINKGGVQVATLRSTRVNGDPYPEAVTPDIAQSDDLDTFAATGQDTLFEKAVEVAK